MDAHMLFFDLEKSALENLRGEKPDFLVQLAKMRKKASKVNTKYQKSLQKFYYKKHKTRGKELKR